MSDLPYKPDEQLLKLAFMPDINLLIEAFHATYSDEIDELDGCVESTSGKKKGVSRDAIRVAQKLLTWSLLKELAKIEGVQIAVVGRLNLLPPEQNQYSGIFPCYMPQTTSSKQTIQIGRFHVGIIKIPGFQAFIINLGSMGVELFKQDSRQAFTLYVENGLAMATLSTISRITVFNKKQHPERYEAEIPFNELIQSSGLTASEGDISISQMQSLLDAARTAAFDCLSKNPQKAPIVIDSLTTIANDAKRYYGRLLDNAVSGNTGNPGTSGFFTAVATLPHAKTVSGALKSFGKRYTAYWLGANELAKLKSDQIAMRLFSYCFLSIIESRDNDASCVIIGRGTSGLNASNKSLRPFEYGLIKLQGKPGLVFCFRPDAPETSIRVAPLAGITKLSILSDELPIPPSVFSEAPDDTALTFEDIRGLLQETTDSALAELERLRWHHSRQPERLQVIKEDVLKLLESLLNNVHCHFNRLEHQYEELNLPSTPMPSSSTDIQI